MIKNVVVFGASGLCGNELVKQAASEHNLNVTAVVRSAASLPQEIKALPNVKVLEGDVKDANFVDSCIAGQDLVLSGLGIRLAGLAYWNSVPDPEFLRVSTTNIINAMRKNGVKRACIIGAAGTNDSHEKVTFVFRIVIAITALAHVYPLLAEAERMFLDAKDLDICMVRPVGLQDTPKTERVQVVERSTMKTSTISRANVAWYMLNTSLTQPQYELKTPIIADA